MSREVQREESRRDPLLHARYTWSVHASSPRDAVLRALERATGVPAHVLDSFIDVKMVDYTLYLVSNTRTSSSIVARVTEKTSPDTFPQTFTVDNPPLKEYMVTFYPATYHVGRRRI